MGRFVSSALLVLGLAAAPAEAATDLESARAGATAARAKVNEIRARQMTLRSELNQVATRIGSLKSEQKGALITGGELETSLRRSQELSSLLTDAAQQLSRAEGDLERENLLFLTALSAEIDDIRRRWEDTADRAARADLLRRMRALRSEREQVHAMLPAAKVPALEVRGSDDPEDLIEQADALRDSEDKVRQQMRALETRIAQVRKDREMERRMQDFLTEEDLFDDQDRRFRRGSSRGAERLSASGAENFVPDQMSTGAPTGVGNETRNNHPPPAPSAPIIVDNRPFIGGSGTESLESDDTQELEVLQARLKRLQSLQRDLDDRADDLERRAREGR